MSLKNMELKKLIDLVDVFNNQRVPLSSKERQDLEKVYPYYGAQGVVDYVDNYIFDGKYILVAEDGENLKSNNKPICTLTTGRFWVNNHAHILRGNSYNNTDYLFYKLNSTNLTPYVTGSAQPKLNKKNLLSVELYVHSKQDQDKIAKVLSTIDNKIKTNQLVSNTLESMAKTLYDYWFVQFDFPDENGKPYKSSGGKMFYNEMLKREIPEGWGVSNLGALSLDIVTGKTPSRKQQDNFDGEIPFITIGDIRGNTFITTTKETLSEKGAQTQKSKFINAGSLCVSCIATVGLVGFTTEIAQTNQQINSIEFNNEIDYIKFYIYFNLKMYFENTSTKVGNTFDNMNKEEFAGIQVILPNELMLRKYHEIVNHFFDRIQLNALANLNLQLQKESILPLLFNGQIYL